MPTVKVRYSCKVVLILSATVILLAFSSALAQFNVSAIAPAHGSLNVPTNAVISITFSAALDTSFRFADTDLPVNIELNPDTAFSPPIVTYSSDLRTINLNNLNLQTNTRYVLLVTGARNTSHTPLALPATATFSTGAVLPSGSISGTISYTGGASGAIAGVFSAFDNGATVGYAIADNNGDYTVPFLPGGNYFALSIKDINLDGEINPSLVDPIGGYDPDANKLANQFPLPGGTSLAGINITLRNSAPKTARELYSPAIENIAKSAQSDAQLVAMNAGNLGVDGKSTFWIYFFYSAALKRNFGFAGSDAICFPFFDFDESDTLDVPLPADWIDSKAVLDSAQANFGRAFLQKYPNAVINGTAGLIELGSDGGSAPRFTSRFGSRRFLHLSKPQLSVLSKAAAQPQQVWLISYNDEASGRFAFGAFDVRTGIPLFIFRFTTARPNLAAAQAAALQWTPDAQLVLVGAPPGPNFSPIDGASLAWVFAYYSTSLNASRQFIIVNGALVDQQDVANGFTKPIPSGWLDSDKTGPVAESLGGASFRQTHPNAQVDAFMGYVNPAAPNRLLWGFRYTSLQPPASLLIYVDALTGVSVNDKPAAPNEFVLQSAYPNPIRHGQNVQWSFSAPVVVEARASVYNVLGQRVVQLLNGKLPAGESLVRWDGRLASGLPAASGAYFLRFEYRLANGAWQMLTRPVLLWK